MGGYRDVPCGGNRLKRDGGALCRQLTHEGRGGGACLVEATGMRRWGGRDACVFH